jgi:hypothetical protein
LAKFQTGLKWFKYVVKYALKELSGTQHLSVDKSHMFIHVCSGILQDWGV